MHAADWPTPLRIGAAGLGLLGSRAPASDPVLDAGRRLPALTLVTIGAGQRALSFHSRSPTVGQAVHAADAFARCGAYHRPSPPIRRASRPRVRVSVGCPRHHNPVKTCQACVQLRLRAAMSDLDDARRQLNHTIRSEHVAGS